MVCQIRVCIFQRAQPECTFLLQIWNANAEQKLLSNQPCDCFHLFILILKYISISIWTISVLLVLNSSALDFKWNNSSWSFAIIGEDQWSELHFLIYLPSHLFLLLTPPPSRLPSNQEVASSTGGSEDTWRVSSTSELFRVHTNFLRGKVRLLLSSAPACNQDSSWLELSRVGKPDDWTSWREKGGTWTLIDTEQNLMSGRWGRKGFQLTKPTRTRHEWING